MFKLRSGRVVHKVNESAPKGDDHDHQGGLFDEQPAPPKKTRRKGVHKTSMERLNKMLESTPVSDYVATDDDLPVSLWPDPEF